MTDELVATVNPFSQIVKYKFLQRYRIWLYTRCHLCLFSGLLDFQNHANCIFSRLTGVCDWVFAVFGINLLLLFAVSILQKVGNGVLAVLLALIFTSA